MTDKLPKHVRKHIRINELQCDAIDIVEWQFRKINSEKKLKKAVKLLEKAVKKILIDVEVK